VPRLAAEQLRRIADALRDALGPSAPAWSDDAAQDPGVTTLELLAFLAEEVSYHLSPNDPRGRSASARLAAAAGRLRGSPASASSTLQRVSYYTGQLPGEDDLRDEQEYHREKLRRVVRELHGWGVVRGLVVRLASGEAQALSVAPGAAVDDRGELIAVCETQEVALPARGTRLALVLAQAEEPCAPEPVASTNAGEAVAFSRTRETFRLSLVARPAPTALVLARLVRGKARWQLDRGFRQRRLRR
jgi:hypothetical protein